MICLSSIKIYTTTFTVIRVNKNLTLSSDAIAGNNEKRIIFIHLLNYKNTYFKLKSYNKNKTTFLVIFTNVKRDFSALKFFKEFLLHLIFVMKF